VIRALSILKRRRARGVEIAERIGKNATTLLAGTAAFTSDLDGCGGSIVGTGDFGGGAKISVRIDHYQ
jgi:hypothetical protein